MPAPTPADTPVAVFPEGSDEAASGAVSSGIKVGATNWLTVLAMALLIVLGRRKRLGILVSKL